VLGAVLPRQRSPAPEGSRGAAIQNRDRRSVMSISAAPFALQKEMDPALRSNRGHSNRRRNSIRGGDAWNAVSFPSHGFRRRFRHPVRL
jgi:hypothetical protein